MRKLKISAALLALSVSCFAQAEMNFAGLEWLTSSKDAKRLMESKNYKFIETVQVSGATDLRFTGIIGKSSATFRLCFTPSDELVQVRIVTDELSDPAQTFNSLTKSLIEKYGKINEKQDKRSQQFLGISSDTQLSQGIRLGEVYWNNYWQDESDGLEMETLKGGLIRIDYYSEYWEEEYDRRVSGNTKDL